MPNYRQEAKKAAKRYGLDPNVFLRQIGAESGFNPKARSPKGATGIAQIMPDTARGWGVDPTDPIASLDAAAKNMARYVRQYKGSYRKALAAYNAGPGAVEKYNGVPPYDETRNYIKKILGNSDRGSASVPKPRPTSGQEEPNVAPELRTIEDPDARRRVALASHLQRTNPKSLLLKLGVVSESEPTTREITVDRPVESKSVRSGSAHEGERHSVRRGSPIHELFYDPLGGYKHGKSIGAIGGHGSHVHVAAGPVTTRRLGRVAQKMGLSVRENEAFDPVDPVHTEGSYHYSDRAIDVSGSPDKMAAFAKLVKRYMKTRKVPSA